MNGLREGIERARSALKAGLLGPVAAPEPWEEIVRLLDEALEQAEAGNKNSALQRVDVASSKLKALAMMQGGPTFELMDMEDARRTALHALDHVPRAI